MGVNIIDILTISQLSKWPEQAALCSLPEVIHKNNISCLWLLYPCEASCRAERGVALRMDEWFDIG